MTAEQTTIPGPVPGDSKFLVYDAVVMMNVHMSAVLEATHDATEQTRLLYATWAHCLHQPGHQVAHVALNAHEAVHVALRALLVADSAVQGALVAAGALRGALVASEALPVSLYAPPHR